MGGDGAWPRDADVSTERERTPAAQDGSGLSAALASGGVALEQTLRNVSRGNTETRPRRRLRFALVGVQLALAMALVTVATVVGANLLRLRSVDLGIDPERLTGVWLNIDPQRYPTPQERAAYYDRVLTRVRAVPGVDGAGGVLLPSTLTWFTGRVQRDTDRGAAADAPEVLLRSASPEYFDTVGIRFVAGRDFRSSDRGGTQPVAVVSKALADVLWPDGAALDRRIHPGGPTPNEPWLTVVGVVDDVRPSPHAPPSRILYRPLAQSGPPWLYVMVRSGTDPAALTGQLRQAVWSENPNQPVDGPFSIARWVSDMTAELRFAYLGVIFAAVALLVACTSVYGLIAQLAHVATREMGIRKMLGAESKDLIGLFMRRTAAVAGPTVLVGAGLGIALMQLLQSELKGVRVSAVWMVGISASLFGVLVAYSTYVPARAAAAVDPAAALRVD